MRHLNYFLFPILAASGLMLSGCYTQLYTRGYVEQGQDYRRRGEPDTLREAPDSARLAQGSDTAAPESKTVIVNNYYDGSAYRGYAYSDWDYPLLSFGFYSSRYRSYCDPYWWNGYGYRGDYGRRHDRYRVYPPRPSGNPGGGYGGAYQSDKRLFAPDPDYPKLRKGRRDEAPPASPNPAPKASAPQTGSSSSGDNQKSKQDDGNDYPTQKKGRR